MVIELDNQCLICGEHDVESFSIGPLDAKIVVVTNRKSSGRFQDALDLQLKDLGIDVRQVLFTPVIKCRDFNASLTAKQVQYINLLKTYIADNGFIRLNKLYEPPFTRLHKDGIDGLFKNQDAHELIAVLGPFVRKANPSAEPENKH